MLKVVQGTNARQTAVDAFHEKMGLVRREKFGSAEDGDYRRIAYVAQALLDLSAQLEPHVRSVAVCRAHLLIEELGEHLQAVAAKDEVKAFDGLIDLQYVLDGTAEIYDWPMGAGFVEVHRSNMTKTRRSDDPGRVRDKGETFQAPDLKAVLEACSDENI